MPLSQVAEASGGSPPGICSLRSSYHLMLGENQVGLPRLWFSNCLVFSANDNGVTLSGVVHQRKLHPEFPVRRSRQHFIPRFLVCLNLLFEVPQLVTSWSTSS